MNCGLQYTLKTRKIPFFSATPTQSQGMRDTGTVVRARPGSTNIEAGEG